MLWLKFIRKLFKILNGDISPHQIAAGIAFGAILGLTPVLSLHNLIVLLLICIIRVNVSSAIFSMAIFKLLGYVVDPYLSHPLGYLLLVKWEFLTPFWTTLYNLPLLPLTNFNNTVALGGLIISLVIFYPNLILSRKGVIAYRTSVQPKLEKMKIFKLFKGTTIYKWYKKVSDFRGKIT
ncbi:MAG: TIGR03546 family protein [Planctomycetes bacterium]|nr:TIGR03546 family protein [Planctomycetota bacterium]